jgi:hypothetical protein
MFPATDAGFSFLPKPEDHAARGGRIWKSKRQARKRAGNTGKRRIPREEPI